MKNQLKCNVQPVSVSHCNPVYINGRIKYWAVRVEYAGNLAMNGISVRRWLDTFEHNVQAFYENPAGYDALRTILKTNLIIPGAEHMTGFFRYDAKRNISALDFAWRDGLFGRGADRAWKFRLNMLAEIAKKPNGYACACRE